jgi:PKD repeat protein
MSSTAPAHLLTSTRRRAWTPVAVLLAALLALGTVMTPAASAVQPGAHGGQLVSNTNAANWTPHVLDGFVGAIAEVGDTVVVGGNFAQIATAADPTTAINRPFLFSFQRNTGVLNTAFSPVVNGEITSIVPTGDGQTVWIAGGFNTLNGQTVRNLAKVDLATGQRVTAFRPPALNGQVNDLHLRNGKLYLTGRFTTAGSQSRPLLAAVDPVTGALDPDVRASFTDPRNNGFLTIGTADITPDGTRMIVAGNFTRVNGLDRYQIAMLDLTTSPVSVANWQTSRYGNSGPTVFPTYMRDVDFSPNGSFFVVVTTGAYSAPGGDLRDTAARWETGATGTGLQPTWVDYSGGDTLTAVAVTDTAVYVGGHQRWSNNPFAADRVGPGAVSREGLVALDIRSGATLSWNPGRTRAVAVYELVATNQGLWVGSDTDRIAGFQYRGRIAFLSLDPSTTMPAEFTGELPAQVVSLGVGTTTNSTRTRTFTGTGSGTPTQLVPWTPADLPGGPALWLDADAANTVSTSGSSVTEWRDRSGNNRHATQSSSSNRPQLSAASMGGRNSLQFDGSDDRLVFDGAFLANTGYTVASAVARTSSRSDNYFLGGTGTSTNSNLFTGWRSNSVFTHSQYSNLYDMSVPSYSSPTTQVSVTRSSTAGKDTSINGTVAGSTANSALLSGWSGSAVGRANSDFFAGRVGEIVIARSSVSDVDRQRLEGYLAHKWGTTASLPANHPFRDAAPQTAAAGPVDPTSTSAWSNVRGAFMVDGKLYTGWSDGTFRVQDYDGTTFGPQSTVPLALIEGNSASLNRFATEDLPNVTGMFYDKATGRLYFTRSDSNSLLYRRFSPESRIVGGERMASASGAGGVSWSNVRSMFLASGKLYTSDGTGNLVARDWSAATGLPTGAATTVSGPTIDGDNWFARDAFVYAQAGVAVPNTPPTASFTSSCTNGSCQFDASASADPDGTIASYIWNFGDSTSPGTGVTANHIYAASGTYTVSLTVTDNRGASSTTTGTVQVTLPNVVPVAAFNPVCTGLDCAFDGSASADPDGTIVSWAWDFGDGATSSSPLPAHSYAAAGTYVVSLTVTDDRGATNTKTTNLAVIDPNATPTVTFRAATGIAVNSTSATVQVPSSVEAGDVMVLIATSASTTAALTGPAGWTLLDAASDGIATAQTAAWTRTATASDAGTNVRVNSAATAKMTLQLSAYDGANAVSAHQVAFDTVSRTERTTPTVAVTTPGSAVVSFWADKSNDNSGWTLPAAVSLRHQAVGSGNGRMTAALTDTTPVGAGPAGGLTAVGTSANRRGIVWSIVVAPDTTAPNLLPTAAFTSNCTALACTFDASGSTDPDGTITSYAWSFGNGTTATGVTANRTYAAAGTYNVSLTVTDDRGATNTTTRAITVTPPVAANVAFRAATGTNVNSTSATLTIPSAVAAGDLMVMIATTNGTSGTLSTPAGWTLVNSGSNASMGATSVLWSRVAGPTDAGSTVTVANTVTAKMALQLSAYGNAGGITAHAVAFDTVNRATRTTPIVPVSTGGSALVSYWADKSGATTTWTPPAAAQLRHLSVGSGSGRITAALADSGSLNTGTAGGLSATADSSNARGITWSVVIAPSA